MMSENIKEIKYEEMQQILDKYDIRDFYERTVKKPASGDLLNMLQKYTNISEPSLKTVIGIDIYRYGNYPAIQQTLIPFIFKMIYDETVNICLESNQFLFQKYTRESLRNDFIPTGDGGFQIFDTPLHAITFLISFSVALRSYNSFHFYPKLRDIVGELNLRYAITLDDLYYFDKNFYGAAIISNARILSKDTLNRLLIDENTYNWFMFTMSGIENLQTIRLYDIVDFPEFKNYDKKYLSLGNIMFAKESANDSGICGVDILKVGTITAKETKLSIFNLHLQIMMIVSDDRDQDKVKFFTISVGNLNTADIS